MDSDGQLTFEDDIVTIRYKQGFQHLVRRDFRTGLAHFRDLLEQAPSDNVGRVVRVLEFVVPRYAKLDSLASEEEKAGFLKKLWRETDSFFDDNGIDFPEFRDQVRKIILGEAAEMLVKRFQKMDVPDVDLLCDLASCFLDLRDYEKAEETLVYADRLSPANPAVLALRSDTSYFRGDAGRARGFLREAFFRDPDLSCVDRLKSGLVKEIRLLTLKEGHEDRLTQWMPVVATCSNLFDVKREFSKEEVLDLEEQARSAEEKIARNPRLLEAARPGLLFRYLLLMDNILVSGHVDNARLAQYEAKLKKLDEKTYSAYIKSVFYGNGARDV